MSIGQIRFTAKNKTALRTGILFVSLFLVLLSSGQASAAIETYDEFPGTGIDTGKWGYTATPAFLTVGSGVLHAAGTGDSTLFPKDTIATTSTFSGHFGAAITYFNFSHSGYTPQPTDPRPPSISLMIGDWDSSGVASNNYYLVSLSWTGADYASYGWREFNQNGDTLAKDVLRYPTDQPPGPPIPAPTNQGALVVEYDPGIHKLNLGYFVSTNPNDWDSPDNVFNPIKSFEGVYFDGDPRLGITFSTGGGGSTSVDVGGLYYEPQINNSSVPLPPSVLLLAPGLIGLAAIRRRFTR